MPPGGGVDDELISCLAVPPKWDWVDPLKDARAEIEQIDAGPKSRDLHSKDRALDQSTRLVLK